MKSSVGTGSVGNAALGLDTGIIFTQFVASIQDILPRDDLMKGNNNTLMNESMASCHSITQVEKELVGDPLEIKMF